MTKYKLVCRVDGGSVLGHAVIWVLLTIITLGIALPFYGYFFFKHIINRTEIHEIP